MNYLDAWNSLGGGKEVVVSVTIFIFTTFLGWLFRARVKLTWGSTSANFHQFKVGEAQTQINVWTEKFFVQNGGKKAASDIELVFSAPPTSYNLWPPREHFEKIMANGNLSLKVPSLAAGELLVLDIIDIDLRNPKLLTVNCPDAISKNVAFQVNRRFGWVVNTLVFYMMAAGFFATIYVAVRIIAGAIK